VHSARLIVSIAGGLAAGGAVPPAIIPGIADFILALTDAIIEAEAKRDV
jgi:hypothetical protein